MHREGLEQTLVLIKPDALKNSLTGYVLSQLSEFHSGLRFAGAKIVCVSLMLAQEHYSEHCEKPFFRSLLEYITGVDHYPDQPWKRRVIALVYQGENAIKKIRDLAGPTNPHRAREERPGSIRSLGTMVPVLNKKGEKIDDRMDNLLHASSSPEDAEREIKLWFKPNDIPPLMRAYPVEICRDHYYYLNGEIFEDYREESICLLAPGNSAWKTDLDCLRAHIEDKPAPCTIGSIAAKYLINELESSS